MRVKKLLVMALIALPTMVMAQSTYEPVGSSDNKTPLENKTVNPVYQQWLSQYVEVRGYPKKKTVQAKMELVSQYIYLLKQERDTPELNQNLDVQKVNDKISLWQSQLDGLANLLKKI